MGHAVLALGLAYFVVAIYAQRRLSGLLDFVRNRADLMHQIGWVSDLYFIVDMSRMRYGFVRYLYRNETPPPEIGDAFPDYAEFRRVSNLAFGLHVAMLVMIVAAVLLPRGT